MAYVLVYIQKQTGLRSFEFTANKPQNMEYQTIVEYASISQTKNPNSFFN